MLYPSVMVSIVPATPKNPLNNKYVEVSLPEEIELQPVTATSRHTEKMGIFQKKIGTQSYDITQ